ncbi:MAG: aminotransferase class IV [Anaerolineae bacterium]|nr:aminotransferase class IV [Anaerolineae bacterium]
MAVQVWEVIGDGDRAVLNERLSEKWPSMTTDDITRELPIGAYTTFRTYNHHFAINVESHFDRLEETARLANKPISLQRAIIRAGIRAAIEITSNSDSRIRILVDLSVRPGRVFLLLEPLRTPAAECYEKGVDVVTSRIVRDNPQAKLTNFIFIAHEARQSLNSRYEEILRVDEMGRILEGLTSNFFVVVYDQLRTAEHGVLLGVTRSIVLKEALQMGIEIRFEPVSIHEIAEVTEAFITSSSRGVLPVRSIDRKRIGSGMPGPYTQLLIKQFEKKILKLLRPI